MRRILNVLPGLCVVLCASTARSETRESLMVGQSDPSQSRAHLQVERLDPQRTAVRLDGPEISQFDHWVDYQRLRSFAIAGEALLPAEARPALPQVTRLCQIPNQGRPHLELGALDFDLVENVDALPLALDTRAFAPVTRDAAVYSTDAWYPEQVATLSEPMICRDLRVVQLTLYPVQVNPVTRQARIYRNLEAQIVTAGEPGENEILNPRQISGAWVPVYRNLVANLDEAQLAGATTTPGSYLIICRNNVTVMPFADSLFQWKTRKGFHTVVDARSTWDVNAVHTAIINAYNTWDPPLEYVCLLGDPQVASWGIPVDPNNFDHAYALAAGNDEIEDVGVGRLSGSSGAEMAVINAKIMGYERSPYMVDTTWYRRAYLLAGVADQIASNWTLMQWAAQQFRSWTGVTNPDPHWVYGGVIPSDVISEFNTGISFFLWRGSWLGQMGSDLAGQTSPGWRLPICLCVTCGANNYNTELGVAESYLVAGTVNNPRGGVAAVGTSTYGTHAPQNITFTGGVVFAIANQAVEHLGDAVAAGKLWLGLTYGWTDVYQGAPDFSRWNNLMGDPGLSMWTDVPVVLSAVHPAALSVGARSVAVAVTRGVENTPVADALVVLWKRGPDSTWVRGRTDTAGQVLLPVNVRAIGDMFLTITKRNHKPYLATLPCAVSIAPNPQLAAYVIDDDSAGGTGGDNNGRLNPGEIVDLAVYVRNFGSGSAATGLTATLTSRNPRVTVLTPTATYSNLAPGDSALGSAPFRLVVSPQMQQDETALLTLAIAGVGGPTEGSIPLSCSAGSAAYVSQTIGGGALDPGVSRELTVTIRNDGPAALNGVSGELRSFSPFIQVIDGSGSYGTIGSGGQATNTTNSFIVAAHALAYRGHRASMLLLTHTVDGQVDSVMFTLTVATASGTDPCGPDDYGYYAYDNLDVSCEYHPTFSYLDISAGLGASLDLIDTGIKTEVTFPPSSTARRLPFPFRFYGQVYDSITICSNGWCAFGNQAWNDNFRNFSIPAMQAPQAMVAPYWDDLKTSGTGLGVWLYNQVDSHRVVIQWKAQCVYGAALLNFEVILYDPAFHPTLDGNGKVLVQYQTVTVNLSGTPEPAGCGVGIQDQRGLTGLGYYNNLTGYAPGAAILANGRAILYTTSARMLMGDIEGTVVDAANLAPLAGAEVTIDGFGYHATTGDDGAYRLADVIVGAYTLRSSAYRHNDAIHADVTVALDSVSSVHFALQHPQMALSTAFLSDSLGSAAADTGFSILNAGNGPLDYTIRVRYAGGATVIPWDSVGAIAVTDSTADFQIQGCEFAGDYWWVTGGGGPGGQNVIYKFDRYGNQAGFIPQPSAAGIGWFDMAWDGQRLYGSNGPYLIGIDLAGNVVDSISSPLNPSRAMAYDPASQHFWVADFGADIYELDRQGGIVHQYANAGPGGLTIAGLAWHPADSTGHTLYIFSQNGPSMTRVSRLNPATGHVQTVVDLASAANDRAGGCAITGGWNSERLVFGGIMQNTAGDRLEFFQIAFNTTWISVLPTASAVPPNGQSEIDVHFDPETLRNGVYHINLEIASAVYDSTMVLPVTLTVHKEPSAVPASSLHLPTQFALYQNYPNPFNPATRICFDLPNIVRVRLEIYNSLGQLVATLADDIRAAGRYTVAWDGHGASGLVAASGLYFVRLQAGDFVSTKKMLLIK